MRLLRKAFERFIEHNGADRAAAVAYYALLSLLPLFIFLISIGVAVVGSFEGAFSGTVFLLQGVLTHLDPASREALRGFVERASRFEWPGLVLLAWTARRGFGSLFSALEKIFGAPPRGFARGNLLSLVTVLLAGAALLLTLALTLAKATVDGLLLRFVGPAGTTTLHEVLGFLLVHVIPPSIAFVFFFALYRVVPAACGVTALQAGLGAALATVLWETAKALFAYYVRDLAHYAGIYGTLEGVIVLSLWLELSVSIILFCAEIVAVARFPLTAPSAGG